MKRVLYARERTAPGRLGLQWPEAVVRVGIAEVLSIRSRQRAPIRLLPRRASRALASCDDHLRVNVSVTPSYGLISPSKALELPLCRMRYVPGWAPVVSQVMVIFEWAMPSRCHW